MVNYNIISTGSHGNATLLEGKILIDCGVPYNKIEPHIKDLNLVLLTHSHGDHFKKSTIKKIATERPLVRFGCGEWLLNMLLECGVKRNQIDIYNFGLTYNYGLFTVNTVPLKHDVPNCGYKVHFVDVSKKVIYCTDCQDLNGIEAYHYDLYLIEANYDEEEMEARIREKKEHNEFIYEMRAQINHLSRQACDKFLYNNAGINSEYIYMHQHLDRGNNEERHNECD